MVGSWWLVELAAWHAVHSFTRLLTRVFILGNQTLSQSSFFVFTIPWCASSTICSCSEPGTRIFVFWSMRLLDVTVNSSQKFANGCRAGPFQTLWCPGCCSGEARDFNSSYSFVAFASIFVDTAKCCRLPTTKLIYSSMCWQVVSRVFRFSPVLHRETTLMESRQQPLYSCWWRGSRLAENADWAVCGLSTPWK